MPIERNGKVWHNYPELWGGILRFCKQNRHYRFHRNHPTSVRSTLDLAAGDTFSIVVLIELGADVNARDDHGQTAMHSAASRGRGDARILAELGGDVKAAENDGWAPLHSAAWQGHVDATRVLAVLGGDVNERKNGGMTPMHSAAISAYGDAIRTLAERSGKDEHGETSMHFSARY